MSIAIRGVILLAGLGLLLLGWLGWQHGGLALMQLGMSIC